MKFQLFFCKLFLFLVALSVQIKKNKDVPFALKCSVCSVLSSSPHGEQKANVGLNLKFNKKNEEVPGYTKKVGTEWMYSSAVEQLLGEYIER